MQSLPKGKMRGKTKHFSRCSVPGHGQDCIVTDEIRDNIMSRQEDKKQHNLNYVEQVGCVTQIISAFPGTGKTEYWGRSNFMYSLDPADKVLDSDSTKWSKLEDGSLNPEFPENYIQHINDNIGKVGVILVSSHENVRQALVDANIPFWLVYPYDDPFTKKEYIERYVARGSVPAFIDLVHSNWSDWITSCDLQKGCRKNQLGPDSYLSDVMPFIRSTV